MFSQFILTDVANVGNPRRRTSRSKFPLGFSPWQGHTLQLPGHPFALVLNGVCSCSESRLSCATRRFGGAAHSIVPEVILAQVKSRGHPETHSDHSAS